MLEDSILAESKPYQSSKFADCHCTLDVPCPATLHGNLSGVCVPALPAQLLSVRHTAHRCLPADSITLEQATHQGQCLARRFCRQHHYDDNALFQHMHSRHEHCFICRRRQPQKYVYYRDLEELAGEHPSCVA